MAVKPEVIKARLKALFPKANLSQKRLDAIAAKLCLKPADDADDAAVDEVLNAANDFHSFEDIAKDDDRIRTLEARPANPPQPQPTPEPQPQPTPSDDDEPKWVSKLMERIEKIEKKTEIESKQSLALKALQSSTTLPEKFKTKWANRVDLNSETPFEDQVKELEEEYAELIQGSADETEVAGGVPMGTNPKGPTDAELESVVNSIR